MPSTYTLIKGETLASNATSYTFTAIPNTFTDLCLRISARDTSTTSYPNQVMVKVNAITSYSKISLEGYGSSPYSQSANHGGYWLEYGATSSSQTSNTFASSELYIPNYTNTTANKPASGRVASPENGTTNPVDAAYAMLMINNAAITSLTITTANNFVAGSSFYLYGIKSS
jgi:hypothetical protein